MSWLVAISSLCFLICMIQAESMDTPNYCDHSFCNGHVHVGCKRELDYAKDCTVNAYAIFFGDVEQEIVLNHINEVRNKVARGDFKGLSGASNMPNLVWDTELAYLAQLNVLRCKLNRDVCRNTKRFKNVGQTVSYRGQRNHFDELHDSIRRHIDLWFNEERFATMKDISRFSGSKGKPVANFAQLVYEDAHRVGCAALQQSKNGWFQTFLTCNYDEAPVVGQPIFNSNSQPASSCVSGINPTFKYLCNNAEGNDAKVKHINKTEEAVNDNNEMAHNNNEQLASEINMANDTTFRTINETLSHVPEVNREDDLIKDGVTVEVKSEKNTVGTNNAYETAKQMTLLEKEMYRATFNRFMHGIVKAETAKVVLTTMNHEVDINNEITMQSRMFSSQREKIRNIIKNYLPFGKKSSAEVRSGPRLNKRTKNHPSGSAKWRAIRH